MEGHFVRGYGDSQKPNAEIELLPGAVEEADDFLEGDAAARARLVRVAELIEGFETPYGMELLATVHWVAHQASPGSAAPARGADQAIQMVRQWSMRKQNTFQPDHVRVAWQHLQEAGWIAH